MKKISYHRHRYHPDIIKQAIWLYFRFIMSYRDVEELLAERDVGAATQGEEYQIAGDYISAQFAKMGLTPAGDAGTFQQNVQFGHFSLEKGSAETILSIGDNTTALKFGENFLMTGSESDPETHAKGDIVFVGYGISAPGLGHDDYAKIDVKGKMVAFLPGAPDIFSGDLAVNYGFTTPSTKASTIALSVTSGKF